MKYHNPIIQGFHPDPSVVRVGEDFYLVNSSFEYFPGLPVYHSRDLINWEQIGHGISRESQLPLRVGFPGETGTFAATIRYHEGIFYLICTNVTYGGEGDGNFIICTEDPGKVWSDPIYVDCPGIDPSLFFKDGDVYYTGTADNRIYLCKIDVKTGKRLEDIQTIWYGTGGNDPEGPHIYYEKDWYYLLISEGGTEYGHMITMARSKNIYGPYESCPHNPVLTNRSTSKPIKAIGHADLFSDQNGNYWAVCLGIRPITYPFKHNLGRETMLTPVVFGEDEWPVFGNHGILEESIETNCLPVHEVIQKSRMEKYRFVDDFTSDTEAFEWNYIYKKQSDSFERTKEGLMIHGTREGLESDQVKTWMGIRQQHHSFSALLDLEYLPVYEGEEAGVTVYMNHNYFDSISFGFRDQKQVVIFRRQVGSLWKEEVFTVQIPEGKLKLYIEGNESQYLFGYVKDSLKIQIGQGETSHLTTEVGGKFTGNYIGIYGKATEENQFSNCLLRKFTYEEL